jgi:competence protein ComEC
MSDLDATGRSRRRSTAVLAWCTGVALVQALPALPSPAGLLAAAAGVAGVAWRLRGAGTTSKRLAGAACIVVACLLAGSGYAVWRAQARLADELPPAWEGEDVVVVGIVDDLPRIGARGPRFAFAVEHVATPGARVPSRVSLAWVEAGDAPLPSVRAGERWRLTVRLVRPHGLANPAGFDLEAWLLERNLRATGYVRADAANARLDDFAGRAVDRVQRARERVRQAVADALPQARYAGVLTALAIGDQSGLTEAQWTVFNRTGTGHLISVSGLHVTVFALMAGGAAFALLRRVPWVTSRVPARKLAALAGLAASFAYVLLAGAEVPARRTLCMLAVGTAGLWLARPGSAFPVWLAALAIVVTLDPWASLAVGFWLSFLAVGVLIYAGSGRICAPPADTMRAKAARALAAGAQAQWAVTLGLVPASLVLFGQVSVIGPLANAIAIPWVTFAVVPTVLAAAVVPPLRLWPLAHALLDALMRILEPMAAAPGAAWAQHAPQAAALPFAAFGIALALAPRGVPGRWLGLVALAPLALLMPPRPPPGAFRVTVLDVGQGTAVVVETHEHALLYDTGPRWNDAADAGARVVAPMLRAAGLRALDVLVVSHRDLDHAGGALSVLQQVPVGTLRSSLDDGHPIVLRQRERGEHRRCLGGQAWTWDGVRFEVLFPDPRHYDDPARKSNDLSCVLRIAGGHGVALLAGDIEAVSEQALLLDRRERLAAHLLVAPHHGSRTSSTPAFVRAVAARHVVFTVGYRNRFGHPRDDVVARYAQQGAVLHRTDRTGALVFAFAAPGPGPPTAQRERAARYWHDRSAEGAPRGAFATIATCPRSRRVPLRVSAAACCSRSLRPRSGRRLHERPIRTRSGCRRRRARRCRWAASQRAGRSCCASPATARCPCESFRVPASPAAMPPANCWPSPRDARTSPSARRCSGRCRSRRSACSRCPGSRRTTPSSPR